MKDNFPSILKNKMIEKHISSAELARRVDVTDTSIYRYTNGIAKPRRLILERIALVLGCSPEDF